MNQYLYWLLSSFLLISINLPIVVIEGNSNNHTTLPLFDRSKSNKLPIVFVYSVVGEACQHGLPSYIATSLQQTIDFQSMHSDVILASNFDECQKILESVSHIGGLKLVDINKIQSEDTLLFHNYSANLFDHSYNTALWVTSALRFFNLLDIMIEYEYDELLHVEADNLLYGNISSILPILRHDYPLAATPLAANQAYVTASVLYTSSRTHLHHFTEFLLNITINRNNLYKHYLVWLRRYACCKTGGVDPDENNRGIKPYAINEMSILAFYHLSFPMKLKMLPVLPYNEHYVQRRFFCSGRDWMAGGAKVGPGTGNGIWDSNSWGQYLGGTHKKRGKDKGFIDNSHIIGQMMLASTCRIQMLCTNITQPTYHTHYHNNESDSERKMQAEWLISHLQQQEGQPPLQLQLQQQLQQQKQQKQPQEGEEEEPVRRCYTAPFVQCGVIANSTNSNSNDAANVWTPLFNLHVHSKQTELYRSIPCDC